MKSKVKKKSIGITLAIMIMISLLTGCGEHMKENRAEEVKEPETETVQTDEWTETQDETGQAPQANCDDAEEMILLARIIYYNPDGTSDVEREYEYDSSGKRTKELIYDFGVTEWREWEYDAFGKLVKEKEYTPFSSVVEWPEEYWREREYDSSGNLTKETWYDFDGGINDWKEYEYDVSGNPTKMLYYDADGNVKYQEEWEYDEFGNQIMESHSTSNGTNWIEWEYDSPENPTHETETLYDWDGKVYVRRERTYAPTGSLTREIFYRYNEDGSILWGEECEYDSLGNKITEIRYGENGSTNLQFEWEYDSFGNRITEIRYGENGSISSRYEWEYDSFGNKIAEIRYGENGSIISRYEWEYEYDAFGKKTKEISYDADGNVKTWMEWERDAYGKTTKKIWYEPDGSIGHWKEYEYITLVVIAEEDLYDKFLNGEQCVGDADIYYFITPTGEPNEVFGGSATCIGYPTVDGDSAGFSILARNIFAMSAKSANKEGAWAFIESYLTTEESIYSNGFPVVQSLLEERIDEAVNAEIRYLTDEDGNYILDKNGNPYEVGNRTTPEEVAQILTMMELALPAMPDDDVVMAIISEEAEVFFQGQKSVDEVAGIIQNRVALYMSENL